MLALLHVDRHRGAARRRPGGEGIERLGGQVVVEAEPELGELDRDVGVEAGGGDPVETGQIVVAGGLRLGPVGDVLTEVVERHPRPRALRKRRNLCRLVERLPGDESGGQRTPRPGGGEQLPDRTELGDRKHGSPEEVHGQMGGPAPAASLPTAPPGRARGIARRRPGPRPRPAPGTRRLRGCASPRPWCLPVR